MTTGKEAFDSACQIGVSKSYNYRQLSQVFMGVNDAINGVVSSGVGNIYASGQLPDGTVDGQLGLVQKDDGGYYVYVWIEDRWEAINIKTFDVTPETFVNISGTELNNQQDINYYLDNRIDQVALGSGGVTYELLTDAPNPTIDLLNSDGVKTSVTYTTTGSLTFNSVSGAIVVDSSSIDNAIAGLVNFDLIVASGFTSLSGDVAAIESDVSTISGRVDDLEVTRGANKIYHFDTIGIGTAIRAGDLVVNNAAAADVSYISIAPFDENNNPAPLVEAGDLIDLEVNGVTNRYLAISGTTDAQTIFCGYVQGNSTFVSGENVIVYAYPQNSDSASLEYVNEELDKKADITYVDTQDSLLLSKSGGTLTGNLSFVSGAIVANNLLSNLGGRTSLQLKATADRPVGIETGSSYKPALQIFGYDNSFPDNRKPVITFNGNGNATFSGSINVPNAPTDNDHLTNKAYVDSKVSASGGTISGDITLSENTLIKSEINPLINIQVSDAIYHRGTSRFQRTFLTGNLDTDSLIKSTRNSGYAFQVKPDDITPLAFIHTNGNAEFVRVKVNAEPVEDVELTNKLYVDTKIAEVTTSGIDTTGLMTLDTEQTITESGTKTIESLFTFSRLQGEVPVRFLANNNKVCEIYYDSADTTRLDITEGKEFKVVTTPVSGVAQQVFKTYTDGSIKVEHLKEPDQPHQAATKSYVDARTAPAFRWERVANNSGAENLTAGQFFVADNGNIYFHPVSANGIDLNVNSITTGVSSSFKQLVTVHAEDGSPKYFITMSEITFNNSSNKYMRLTKSFVHIDDVTVVGQSYRLNIPGFTF